MAAPTILRRRGAKLAELRNREIAGLVRDLGKKKVFGRDPTALERLLTVRKLAEAGGAPTLEVFLPLLLNLKGRPYTLKDHFPFSPLFRTVCMPSRILFKTGRQTSKSTSIASHGVVLANAIRHPTTGLMGNFTTLYVMPLYEQVRRFSTMYVRPFIEQSPVKALWSTTATENSVLQRTFVNDSRMIFSFALLDADRIRGISADKICIDEAQDMDPDHIPIITETMSHSPWRLLQFTGTPKTMDNTIEGLWMKSSQAEWFIPCGACGKWSIPSREHHILKMLGPWRPDISEASPGIVCAHCERPIHPRLGSWVHKDKTRIESFPGYHVPQCILPLHYSQPKFWGELLAKKEGIAEQIFWNEVMGESADTGLKLVTETDLKNAAVLEWSNNEKAPSPGIKTRLRNYKTRVMGIDWGGGGEDGVSFTALALLGFTAGGKIDVLWGKRLLNFDHMAEAHEIKQWVDLFKCDFTAHDYTGAGTVRETILHQVGIEPARILPMQYVRAATKGLLTFVPATQLHPRNYYRVDKTRSLLYTCQAIKLNLINFFRYDYKNDDNPGLMRDFLALVENKTESRLGGDIYTITKNPMLIDDWAHAVNLGTMACWHVNEAWPNFGEIAKKHKITKKIIAAFGNTDYGWAEDPDPDSRR